MFQAKTKQQSPPLNVHVQIRPDKHSVNIPFPKISQPKHIGFFSIEDAQERNYEPSISQLRYFKMPEQFPLDLNEGLNLAIKKPESVYNEKLDHLLKFIFDARKRLFCSPAESATVFGAEFVCWRDLLCLLMSTPYELRQNWCIHVTRYKGTFYLYKCDTTSDKKRRATESEMDQKLSSWGFKFEQYCLADLPNGVPNTNAPVDECSEFKCVFRTQIGGLHVLYGAEMDGVISEEPVTPTSNALDQYKFIGLKVRQNMSSQKEELSYKFHKARKWWCQSFLVGINDIYLGLADENGFIHKIDQLNVRQLTKESKLWVPAVCANFLEQFFKEIKKIMADVNCPYTIYEFRFNSRDSFICYECFHGISAHSFLPHWFVELLIRSSPVSFDP